MLGHHMQLDHAPCGVLCETPCLWILYHVTAATKRWIRITAILLFHHFNKFMVWFIQRLELSVLQHLELMLNNRDVNFLSTSLDIALSSPQLVVVVACGLTSLHAKPLGYVGLLSK